MNTLLPRISSCSQFATFALTLPLFLSLSYTHTIHTHNIYTRTTQFSEPSRCKFWTSWNSHLQKIQHVSWEWGQLFSIIAVKLPYSRNMTVFQSLIDHSIAEFPLCKTSGLGYPGWALIAHSLRQVSIHVFSLFLWVHCQGSSLVELESFCQFPVSFQWELFHTWMYFWCVHGGGGEFCVLLLCHCDHLLNYSFSEYSFCPLFFLLSLWDSHYVCVGMFYGIPQVS